MFTFDENCLIKNANDEILIKYLKDGYIIYNRNDLDKKTHGIVLINGKYHKFEYDEKRKKIKDTIVTRNFISFYFIKSEMFKAMLKLELENQGEIK